MTSSPTRRPGSPWLRAKDHRRPFVLLLSVATLATAVVAGVRPAAAVSLPSCSVADVLTTQRSINHWAQTVLDSHVRLPSGYAPTDLRSTTAAGLNIGYSVRALVIPDLKAMAAASRAAGARLAVVSAYRSYTSQRTTFAYWVRVHGYAYALRESARAGHSEHQLGTTLDFGSYGFGKPWNSYDWSKTKAGTWLGANAWRYGFIMSYPKGKTGVTCYMSEPWHFRYVGRDVAAKVHASHLTLREYLWRQQTGTLPRPTPSPTPMPTPSPTPTPTPFATDPPD